MALTIHPGLWRLRSGIVARVERRLTLHCNGREGPFDYDVWQGRCLCCNAAFTWEIDGRWSPVEESRFDIVGDEA